MKIILSRKGFDSSTGGNPSPIFSDSSMVSLFIPSDVDDKAGFAYSEIKTRIEGENYTYLDVFRKRKIYNLSKKKMKIRIDEKTQCHLDPDLKRETMQTERKREWRPIFGQDGNAQSHLAKCDVGPDDLFVFYGWFRGNDGKDIHAIFGYLQVGKKIELPGKKEALESWMLYHPHANPEGKVINARNNCIYVAKEKLSFDKTLPGAGVFRKINSSLILTREGESRSKWITLPFTHTGFRQEYVSHHKDAKNLESAEEWARNLIEKNRANISI